MRRDEPGTSYLHARPRGTGNRGVKAWVGRAWEEGIGGKWKTSVMLSTIKMLRRDSETKNTWRVQRNRQKGNGAAVSTRREGRRLSEKLAGRKWARHANGAGPGTAWPA